MPHNLNVFRPQLRKKYLQKMVFVCVRFRVRVTASFIAADMQSRERWQQQKKNVREILETDAVMALACGRRTHNAFYGKQTELFPLSPWLAPTQMHARTRKNGETVCLCS